MFKIKNNSTLSSDVRYLFTMCIFFILIIGMLIYAVQRQNLRIQDLEAKVQKLTEAPRMGGLNTI